MTLNPANLMVKIRGIIHFSYNNLKKNKHSIFYTCSHLKGEGELSFPLAVYRAQVFSSWFFVTARVFRLVFSKRLQNCLDFHLKSSLLTVQLLE